MEKEEGLGCMQRTLWALMWCRGGGARARRGQGTTEYAILVGVLVVIAILSIITFRGKVQELWNAIASGIGSL